MADGKRSLQGVGPAGAAQCLGAVQGSEAPADQELVPTGAVLFADGNRRAIWA